VTLNSRAAVLPGDGDRLRVIVTIGPIDPHDLRLIHELVPKLLTLTDHLPRRHPLRARITSPSLSKGDQAPRNPKQGAGGPSSLSMQSFLEQCIPRRLSAEEGTEPPFCPHLPASSAHDPGGSDVSRAAGAANSGRPPLLRRGAAARTDADRSGGPATIRSTSVHPSR